MPEQRPVDLEVFLGTQAGAVFLLERGAALVGDLGKMLEADRLGGTLDRSSIEGDPPASPTSP